MMEFKLCLLLFVAVAMFNNPANGIPYIGWPGPPPVPVTTYSGNQCQFPFVWKGETYTGCTTVDHPRNKSWCITENRPGVRAMCVDEHNLVVDTYGGTGRGERCHFPFTNHGKTYTGCTNDGKDYGQYWCSTTADFDVDQKWGWCNVIDSYTNLKMPKGWRTQWEPTTCVFPFVYDGEIYNGCTGSSPSTTWCSTTSNYDEDEDYKWCDGKDILGTQDDARTRDFIPCVFPYIKDGKLMNEDIYVNKRTHRMCSTTFNYDKDQRSIYTGRFLNYQKVDGRLIIVNHNLLTLTQCFYPFNYGHVMYHGCAGSGNKRRWCSLNQETVKYYLNGPVCTSEWVIRNARNAQSRNQRLNLQ